MRAAYYAVNGSAAEVLGVGEVETPQPGPGEVRIKLTTSGVNPSDVKSRAGRTRKIAFPRVIPHSDGAGVIDSVGDGVSQNRIGERVWVWNGQWKRPSGTAAEYIALPQSLAVPLPASASFEAGACLGIPAMTAVHAINVVEPTSDEVLLISGGAGAVAHYAIQFAKARGATVITTVSSPQKADIARRAGADHVIDYKNQDVGAEVMRLTERRGVDAIVELDLTANAPLIASCLRSRGRVVIYGTGGFEAAIPSQFCLVNMARLEFIYVYELTREERERALTDIRRMLDANTLIHNVAKTMPLTDIVAAHEIVEQGQAAGNVVLTISS
jgi:NADPH2:quinone reductase